MKTYLFLLAWCDGSDSACGEATGVDSQDDLLPEYRKGNEHIFALYIAAPNEGLAADAGYSRAFHENYTGYDSVSTCFCTEEMNINNVRETPLIVVDIRKE